MTEKEKEHYLYLLISKIEKVNEFNILRTLEKETENLNNRDKDKFSDELQEFGYRQGILAWNKPSTGWCFLTKKGIDFKNSKLTFKKFIRKENKNEWYNQNWIGYLIAFIAFLFGVYQHYDNLVLTSQIETLDSQNVKLNYQVELYKDSLVQLKLEFEE